MTKQWKKINSKLWKKSFFENPIYIENLCTDKNNDKNNKKLPPSSSSTPVTAYLIAEKY